MEPKAKQKYWNDDLSICHHAQFDLESSLALRLIEHWGLVAGKASEKEDAGGRQYVTLQTPQELVERAFLTAATFIAAAESRDGIKPVPPAKERAIHLGELEAAKLEAQFPLRRKDREDGPQRVEASS